MTRFRAYSTDSEEEDDDYQPSDISDDSGDDRLVVAEIGSESVQEEGEDEEVPRALSDDSDQTDEEEEEEMESDDDGRRRRRASVQFDPAVKSPPGTQKTLGDLTIIPWARELGVDSQRMHVMQTSLFRMPEEEASLKALAQPAATIRRRPSAFSALSRKHSRDSEGEGLRADSRQRSSFAHNIDPAPYRPSRKYARVACSASAVLGSEGAYIDAGLALGRSFRVGWGPGGTLVHLGSLCGPQSKTKTTANSSIIQKTTVPLVASAPSEASERASKLLSHHLSSTPIELDADGVPFAYPSSQLSFSSFTALFPSTDRSFEACLFRLGRALFDPTDLRLGEDMNVDIRNRVSLLRRKAALSAWLEQSIVSSIDVDMRENPGADWAAMVFTLLSGNQAERACEVAMNSGNVKLASLIAQYPGDEEFREDMRTQLALWREQRIDMHISASARKVYALLAGIVDMLEGSKGGGVESCPDIKIAKGLHWKRAFGLHLWFGEPLESSVADVFYRYDQSWQHSASGVRTPIPWYADHEAAQCLQSLGNIPCMEPNYSEARDKLEQSESPWPLPKTANPPDAQYTLIKLYADPACSLSAVLKPLSFSSSPADYRLAWHLYVILSRCLRIRDFADRNTAHDETSEAGGDEDAHVEGHSPSADLLANSYALQLEQMGMIQEAVFVLLHIEGSFGRVKAIKELLGRNATRLDDWTTRGLVGSLRLPMAWVNEAKAIHALDSGNIYGAYELYLAAGLHNAAHELAVLDLAPDAVIRQDLDLLRNLFEGFRGHPVDGWHVRGKAFLDYVHAMIRLPELREHFEESNVVPDAALAVELEQLSRSVPRLISILPDVLRDRSDVRHNAALAEMTAGLTAHLNRIRPLAMYQSQARSPFLSDGIRLRNIQTAAYERFLRSIEVV